MRRPLIQFGIAQLRKLYEERGHEHAILEQLREELTFRSTAGAKQLNAEVLQRIQEMAAADDNVIIELPPGPSRDEPDDEQDGNLAPEGSPDTTNSHLHPDDQKRPASLTRIRPPGTSGLPEPWQRTLSQELTLPVAKDADLPDLFIAALNALIAEIKRNSANQKRYELENGERLETAQDDILYAFPFTDEAELFEEAQIELQAFGRRVEGTIVSISAGRLVLALREDLGAEIAKAILVIDTTALLAALVTKIEQVKKGEVSLNRDLADSIAGRNAHPTKPELIDAKPPKELNAAQQRAFAAASTAAVTWIWGPPGCGKTKTLAEIVRAVFESGRRILVCSNTNKAVDQVLYSICKALETDHPAMREGRVVRLGRIADKKLNDYADYVTIDGIVERRSQELRHRRAQVERALELLDARTLKSQRLIARFGKLDRAAAELAAARELLAKIASDAESAQRSHQRNAQRTTDFQAELEKRQKAFFTLLSRNEESITRDLAAAEAEHANIEAQMQAVRQRYETAKRVFDAAATDHDAMRNTLAGEDRTAAEEAIRIAADERSDFIAELRDIEAKIAAIRETIIKEARILGVTCTKAYLAVREIGQVDLVIIDEASMVLLPVAWFATGLAKDRVIVCGDFRQIPPIVPSEQQSIVDAIGTDAFTANGINENDPRIMMLNTQYRMHRTICQLIAEPMYAGKLGTAADRLEATDQVPPPFNQPLTIVDTSDLWPFESQNAFFSRFNLMNALLVRNIAFHFAKHGAIQEHEDLGICTPYSAQAKIIGKLLEGENLHDKVQVGTVHSYQGDERSTMLLDIPESHGGAWSLGQFVQGVPPKNVGARLINVAISRAKHRLIVLANLTYLDRKLPSTSLLRSVLFDMQGGGQVIRGSDVLALRPIERDLKGLLGQPPFEKMIETFGIFDEPTFELALEHDIREAKRSIVIFSGYVTPARVGKLGDLFRAKIADGLKIRCVTRPPQTNGSVPREQGSEALDMLEGIGVTVDCRAKIHQKICLIDNRIVWLGSLNALSHAGRSDETMTRAVNEGYAAAIAGHMSKRRMSTDKAASSVADAENPRCPECDSRSIYNDGRFGPYFACESECGWRANEKSLNGNSATRNAEDPDADSLPLLGPKCPKCKSPTALRTGRRGKFYGCTQYPKCDGTRQASSDGNERRRA
ncbi:AAA domain-containing protein [Hyphomicrobium facile]|uniref:Phospholipase D n=1 Tax=Hyphomicrobium facile TaxID=51670 RepID=A0A1I7N491_9HYPH|nr:AAA domain-containing protein [Hyphomicrobium facile]SFV29416.1 PLD-like domain-containing protein [Hyphomicrobium facile]